MTFDNILNIIVLLILAGITISALSGDNGILTRTVEAKNKNEIAREKEQITIAYSGCKINNLRKKVTAFQLQEEMIKNRYNAKVAEGINKLIVTYEDTGHVYTIGQERDINENYIYKKATLDTGNNINSKMSTLAQGKNNITAILYSAEQPDISTMTSDNIVSTSDSEYPVYFWYENGTIYWWSEAECPILNENSSGMFSGLGTVTNLSGIATFDASNVKNMSYMFNYMNNVKDFSPIESWNVEIVENIQSIFEGSKSNCSLDLHNWNVENVTSMSYAFFNSGFKEINISKWNISKINTLYMLFSNCEGLETINLSDINTENVEDFQYVFQNCKKLKNIIGIETLNVGEGKSFFYMFAECQQIKSLDLSKWNMKSATSIKNMVYECTSLEHINLSNWNLESMTRLEEYTFDDINSKNLKSFNASSWNLPNATSIAYAFYGIGKYGEINATLETLNINNWNIPNVTDANNFSSYSYNVTNINIKNWNAPKLQNMKGFFTYSPDTENIDMSNWTTGSLTNISSLMEGNTSLKSIIGWGSLDTSTVTNMSQMAGDCRSLTDISELANWDVSNVEQISEIFRNCKLLSDFSPINDWDLTKAVENDSSFNFSSGAAGHPEFTKVQGTWNNGYFTAT